MISNNTYILLIHIQALHAFRLAHIAIAWISCMHFALYVWLSGHSVRILYKTFKNYVELCKSYVSQNTILNLKNDAKKEPKSCKHESQMSKMLPKCCQNGSQILSWRPQDGSRGAKMVSMRLQELPKDVPRWLIWPPTWPQEGPRWPQRDQGRRPKMDPRENGI